MSDKDRIREANERSDRLFHQMFGAEPTIDAPPRLTEEERMANWKPAPPPKTGGKGQKTPAALPGEPHPNFCDCGKWKSHKYDTCMECAGIVLCESCEQNYHSDQYQTCYDCR